MEETIKRIKEIGIVNYLVENGYYEDLEIVMQIFLGIVLQNYSEQDIEDLEKLIINELEEL